MRIQLHPFATLLAVFICLLSTSSQLHAVTYTFIGSGNWSNAANWSGSTIPPTEITAGDAIVINGSGTCTFDDPYEGYLLQIHGTFTLNAGKTMNWNMGSMRIETGGAVNINGTLNIAEYNAIYYDAGNFNVYGTVNINISEGLYSVGNGTINIFGGGTIAITNGSMNVRSNLNIAEGGALTLSSNSNILVYFGGNVNNQGLFTNSATCILELYPNSIFTNQGTLVNNGSLTNYNNSRINGSGSFEGAFEFSTYSKLAPGNSPGCMMFDADFTNNGTIEIELADGSPCINFDQIQVLNGKSATLGGVINISFPSGTPTTTSFPILTATGTKTDNNPVINWPSGFSGIGEFVGNEYRVSFSPLPVELTQFTGRLNDKKQAALHWETASETNSECFEVQRSSDANSWETLGRLAAQGNSTAAHRYHFIDPNPQLGNNYYRLRQVDFDGRSELSNIVNVALAIGPGGISFLPNPSTGITKMVAAGKLSGQALLRIYSLTGNLQFQQAFEADGENNAFDMDFSQLPAGVYLAVFTNKNTSLQQRIVVE